MGAKHASLNLDWQPKIESTLQVAALYGESSLYRRGFFMAIRKHVFIAMICSYPLFSAILEDSMKLQYNSLAGNLLTKKLKREELNLEEWEQLIKNYPLAHQNLSIHG